LINFSCSIVSVLESLVIKIVIGSGLVYISLVCKVRFIDFKNFIENLDFFFEITLFVIEFSGGYFKVILSTS